MKDIRLGKYLISFNIAIKNNQIRNLVGSQTLENLHTHELFSENLY